MKHLMLVLPALLLLSISAEAATVIGVTDGNTLIKFDSATPGANIEPIAITGLAGGETIRAIDFRPATGKLYGISSDSRLFLINPLTAAATLVGNGFTLTGAEFGLDFTPTADRVRVVSGANQNIRLHPDTGVLSATDTSLSYALGDPNFGANPQVTAIAYTNSYVPVKTTTIFGIDTALDILVTMGNPNGGALTTVGALGVDTTSLAGFDIDPRGGAAYAALEISAGQSRLFVINLTTGAATLIGNIGTSLRVRGIAIAPAESSLVGLTTANQLIQFNANDPGTILAGPAAITGLDPSEVILAIDYRPANGQLYGLSNFSRLFTLNATTGSATLVAALSSVVPGSSFGLDFNPVLDRLRIVSNTGSNVRVHPSTGVVTPDDPLTFVGGDPNAGQTPAVTGSAYMNSVAGANISLLYGIDTTLNVLVLQTPQNEGVLGTVGTLDVDPVGEVGFDIEPALNTAFAAMVVGGTSRLYTIGLNSANTTLIGTIGSATPLRGLAVMLFGSSPVTTVTATGAGAAGLQVTVSYSHATGADHYDIYRKGTAGGSFALVGSSPVLQFQDTSVAANTWYVYTVIAVGPGGGVTSATALDLATTTAFADDPLVAGTTVIKAAHVNALRVAVNAVRALAGLSGTTFTDPVLTGIHVKTSHITELRAALDVARAVLGVPAATYTRTLTPAATVIAAVDVTELRNAVK